FLDDERGGRDVALDSPGVLELEPRLRDDVTDHLTVHDHGRAGDLRLDDGVLTDRQRVLGFDLTLDVALHSRRPVERDLADGLGALAEKSRGGPGVRRLLSLVALEHPNTSWSVVSCYIGR